MEKEKSAFEKMWERYKECYYRPLELDEKLVELETRFKTAGAIDYAKVPSDSSPSIDLPLYYVTYKDEIREEQEECHKMRLRLKAEIESLIRANIRRDSCMQIARKKMIDLKTSKVIAAELGYSEAHVSRIVSECFMILNRVKISKNIKRYQ